MKLNLISEDSFFDYAHIAKDMWRDKLKEAKEESGISFNTENDSTVSTRTVTVEQDQWKHTKCQFRCELRSAGGDWEVPLLYFRCQIIKGYADGTTPHNDPYFCVIPDKAGGNTHLIKAGSGWSAPDADGHKKADNPRPNKSKCWRFLEQTLHDMVHREIAKVKKGN